jgi:hypothetical protein
MARIVTLDIEVIAGIEESVDSRESRPTLHDPWSANFRRGL